MFAAHDISNECPLTFTPPTCGVKSVVSRSKAQKVNQLYLVEAEIEFQIHPQSTPRIDRRRGPCATVHRTPHPWAIDIPLARIPSAAAGRSSLMRFQALMEN
jgi:hypothetical protein